MYIEREREVQRRVRTPPQVEQYDTYRYVPGPVAQRQEPLEDYYGRYEDNPRVSVNRVTERERIKVDERGERGGQDRRNYYRR